VLACLDGSPQSETILTAAAAWARRLGTALTLVTVADAAGGADRAPAGSPKAGDYLDGLLDRPELRSLPVSTEVLSNFVAPHRAIADRLAREPATLVALASRTRSGISRMLVGSEAARIIHASPVPVVVQRGGTPA
jgi:nucleotide-binding universal stress UspA family protein